jgi:N,N'-diacetyllegionaminate synthase
MASSHGGDPKIAEFIVERVAKAGADGILFQIFDLESYIVPGDPDYGDAKKIFISQDVWRSLLKKANSSGVEAWANVYDLKSAEFAKNENVKGFKLHSSNLENEELVKSVAHSGKVIHLSVGGMTKEEIAKILKIIYSANRKAKIHLMYGLQNFPTRPEGINLNFIKNLSVKFKVPWGYQDHSEPDSEASIFLPILAVSQGASVIEKHITNSRSLKGYDYQAALNPDEFVSFVGNVRLVDNLLGKKINEVSSEELKYKQYKTLIKVVAKKDINIGENFSEDNLAVMRAKNGEVPGGVLKLLLNKKSKTSYKKNECIKGSEI